MTVNPPFFPLSRAECACTRLLGKKEVSGTEICLPIPRSFDWDGTDADCNVGMRGQNSSTNNIYLQELRTCQCALKKSTDLDISLISDRYG